MAAILVSRWYEFIIFGSMVWVSWWFLCLDLSFWLGLDLVCWRRWVCCGGSRDLVFGFGGFKILKKKKKREREICFGFGPK